MSRPKSKPVVVPLHQLQTGQVADFFALLAEKTHGTTRDNKPYFTCRFKDVKRSVVSKVWADSPTFDECEKDWHAGSFYKVRALFTEHEKYGPQIDVQQLRPIREDDRADGFKEADFFDRSRFDSDVMFTELHQLVEAEVKDLPLRQLIVTLLDAHAEVLKQLPASDRRFFPFPGGWLEHVLSVTRSCLLLTDRYLTHYPELQPPLNRDLVLAGAVLHDIGRVQELTPGVMGQPAEHTVIGRLFGHIALGRDLIRDAAKLIPELNPELVTLLEHIVMTHLSLPEWGSPRLPVIPEVLILHHVDDLDAKLEMYIRCLTRDTSDGPFTEYDPILKKPLFKGRSV